MNKKEPFWKRAVDTVDEVSNTMVTVRTAVIVGSMICMAGAIGLTLLAVSRTNIHISINK